MVASKPLKDLRDVQRYVKEVAADLDPKSRYIADLTRLIDLAGDIEDLQRLLDEQSRGLRHAGADVFAKMTLEEKLLANLITPETTLFRFSEGELEAIDRELLPRVSGRTARVLIVPCSHGEEAFTIAAYFLKTKVAFSIRAFDVQPALIAEAQTGRLTFGYPLEQLKTPGFVAENVLKHIRFEVGNAFELPLGPRERTFDLVLCRNFVGYFEPRTATNLVTKLATHVETGGILFLDGFCLSKMPVLETELLRIGANRLYSRPAFRF
jgi:chemotaxis methyl-accepting protein methylase